MEFVFYLSVSSSFIDIIMRHANMLACLLTYTRFIVDISGIIVASEY